MRVFVYWNLRRKCFSVKALSGPNKGKVVEHVAYFEMADVEFRVSEAGRQRVLAAKRKNVHAGIVGALTFASDVSGWHEDAKRLSLRVTYNPYRDTGFHGNTSDNPIPVWRASAARGYAGAEYPAVFVDGPG